MRTNKLSIVDFPPTLSEDALNAILFRIKTLHPVFDESGREMYLSDLLNVKSLESITGDFLHFQEKRPALSSSELHQLAERILPYNDNSMSRSIFSVRNILNTVPKSVDDLVDYVSNQQFHEHVGNILNFVAPSESVAAHTLDDVVELTRNVNQDIMNIACNNEMERFQNLPLMSDGHDITEEQGTLSIAGRYYINHRLGFECNTIWLAIHIRGDNFGCDKGWVHPYDDECKNLNFGFKDDISVPKLTLAALDYISRVLEEVENGNTAAEGVATQYIETIISSLEILGKEMIKKDFYGIASERDMFKELDEFLNCHEDALSDNQKLRWITACLILKDKAGMNKEQFRALDNMVNNQKTHPDKPYLRFFDAWNFFIYDHTELKTYELAPLFLRAGYHSDSLEKFAEIILDIIEDDRTKRKALSPEFKDMMYGFFTNFLWALVNDNSDDHFLYDTILNVALEANIYVEMEHILRGMAEFGHRESIMLYMDTKEEKEKKYWKSRLNLKVTS
jgi:hypothetical protein